MITDVSAIVKELRKDERYKRLKNAFDTAPIYQISVSKLLTEIDSLQALRKVRRLNSSDPKFVDRVIEANLYEQVARSRLTEIMMSCIRVQSTLNSAIESLKAYYLTSHSLTLKSVRTKEERLQVINVVLSVFIKYVNKISMLKESANLVISDIDKTSWNLRLIIDAVKISHKPENVI